MGEGIKLIPKRKVITNTPFDSAIDAMVAQAVAATLITLSSTSAGNIGNFNHRLKIPVGTDMYD